MDNPGAFAPIPWVTFLVDKAKVECGICFSSTLFLSPPEAPKTDHVPAILPCGHIYGYECLMTMWMMDGGKLKCPECRSTFKHELCEHSCAPRPLDTVNIFTLPPTLKEKGGRLQDQCRWCRIETGKRLFNEQIEGCRDEFDRLRNELRQRGSPAVVEKVRSIKKHLDIMKGVFFNNDILHGW